MKIAYVITGLGMGGAEKVVATLSDHIASEGHDVLLIYLRGDRIVTPNHPSIRVVGLDCSTASQIPRAAIQLRKLLKNFGPDVVHSHLFHANILCRLLRLTTSIPKLISTAHSTQDGGAVRAYLYRLTDHMADISTNVSNRAVNEFVSRKATKSNRMVTVYNGISTVEFCYDSLAREKIGNGLGLVRPDKVLLSVGRLTEAKDYPNLFLALSLLDIGDSNYTLLIAGDGPLKSFLVQLASRLGISERIRFLGIRDDIASLMSVADIFLLSSAWEGFGMAVGEAMATKRLVVATDCGGLRELLGDTGLLVPPKDPVNLSYAISKALNMSEQDRCQLGELARKRVQQHFSIEKAVEKWLRLYKS